MAREGSTGAVDFDGLSQAPAVGHSFQGAVGIVARTPGFAVALGARDPRLTPGNCRGSLGSAELQEFG
jgi:hypothetical protein